MAGAECLQAVLDFPLVSCIDSNSWIQPLLAVGTR